MKQLKFKNIFTAILFLTLLLTSLSIYSQVRQSGKGVGVGNISKLPAKEKRWALIIGVDNYRDDNISDLGGAANDAERLANSLEQYAGFPKDQIIVLSTKASSQRQPTRANILKYLSNLRGLVRKDGLLLVSFSGHGIERGGKAFLIPSDAISTDDIDLLEDTALEVGKLKKQVKQTKVKQVLFLIDACRNDPTSGRSNSKNPLTKSYTRGFAFDVKNKEVEAFATIYATSVGDRAYEYAEKNQGYFSWAVVEALSGKAANKDGEITLRGLIKYIERRVPKLVAIDLGINKVQRPFAIIEGYRADELVLAFNNGRNNPIVRSNPSTNTIRAGTVRKNSIGMELVYIPSGSFMMGSDKTEREEALKAAKRWSSSASLDWFKDEGPQRRVTISKGFWMGKYEVTQEEYEKVMGKNPSKFKECPRCPVETVNWNDAKEFIRKLNQKNDGLRYTLPSEAEWEYAARAGTTTPFGIGDGRNLSFKEANFDGDYPYGNASKGKYLKRTTKVGNYQANAWGLYDMHGNVWEWVEDIYSKNYNSLKLDGSVNMSVGDSSKRVLRGGSWGFVGSDLRSAGRDGFSPSIRSSSVGFRVASRPSAK